jgi:hypothetical protein
MLLYGEHPSDGRDACLGAEFSELFSVQYSIPETVILEHDNSNQYSSFTKIVDQSINVYFQTTSHCTDKRRSLTLFVLSYYIWFLILDKIRAENGRKRVTLAGSRVPGLC